MRVTARGVGLLVAAVALLATGFAFGYAELTVVGATAVVAIAFALAYAVWRPQLAVTRRADPDRVMRGEASRVTLDVHNASKVRGATLVAYDRCGTTSVPVPLLRLRAGSATSVDYPVPTERRGVVPIGPLRVVRSDPLGLLSLARSHGDMTRVWVYPRVHPLTAVPVGIVRSLDGRVDRVPQGTITFDALRQYVVGDELRHVHWRTTARVGELMVREHVDTSLPRLVVLLDDRRASYPDGEMFESACEAAASITLAAFHEELPVVLHLVSEAATAESGWGPRRRRGVGGAARKVARPYLDLLAEATLHGEADLDPAVARLRHRRQGDTLIFLTGPVGPDDIGRVGALRGAYPSIVVGTLGVHDGAPSTMEGLLVLAAGDGADFARRLGRRPGMVDSSAAVRGVVPVALIGMLAIPGVVLERIYSGDLLVRLVLVAAVASVLLSVLVRRLPGWTAAPVSVLGLAALAAIAIRLSASAGQISGALPDVARDALSNSVPRLLTAMIPIQPQPDTVLVPVIVTWLAGLAAAELAVRYRRVMLSYLMPTLLLGGALYLVGPNARPTLWMPLAFAGFAALGLAASGRETAADGRRAEPPAAQHAPAAARGGRRGRAGDHRRARHRRRPERRRARRQRADRPAPVRAAAPTGLPRREPAGPPVRLGPQPGSAPVRRDRERGEHRPDPAGRASATTTG